MYQVEIADACIRVYDMLGGFFNDNIAFTQFVLDMPEGFTSYEDRLIFFHLLVSECLENWRKGKKLEAKMYLYRFLDCCYELAEEEKWSLEEIIIMKCDYNRERVDHRIENRLKADGKKI